MMDDWMLYADPMAGQIAYTSVALMASSAIALDIFRYNPRGESDYVGWHSIAALPGFNYWYYGMWLGRDVTLLFWSVAAVTQL